jgi:hypothetical protein
LKRNILSICADACHNWLNTGTAIKFERKRQHSFRRRSPDQLPLLHRDARHWPIDLGRSFLIGDRDHDLAAAATFRIRGVKFDAEADSLVDLVRRELAWSST